MPSGSAVEKVERTPPMKQDLNPAGRKQICVPEAYLEEFIGSIDEIYQASTVKV
jgi:hypothetical protein